MSQIIIGKHGDKNIGFDLDVLLRTRLLIQANSGKGKSWLLRRLAEQLFGRVQVIIIDPEGEFATLREKFGYVLVGKGGETPADPRSAGLVAHKLLELKASAVADLYEMKPTDRHRWVKLFIDALIDAPKALWHPTVIILDEAHVYCPEKGAGESEASESVIGLATRGRKRGYCLIPATQRLGKFRKDAAAEMLNVCIGGTFIDIDRKRAADCLGVYGPSLNTFFDEIKMLERGSFYCLGPALSTERILVKIAAVDTTHPEAGSAKHAAGPPPAPDKIKSLLPKLADLPKEAEEKARTEAELRTEIRGLKAQLKAQPTIEKPVVDTVAVERAALDAASKRDAEWEGKLRAVRGLLMKSWERFVDEIMGALHPGEFKVPERPRLPMPALPAPRQPVVREKRATEPRGSLGKAERTILTVMAQYPDGRTKKQVALLSGYAISGGGFNNSLGSLRSKGLIDGYETMQATSEGITTLGPFDPLPTGDALLQHWYRQLGKCERAILESLAFIYPQSATKEEIAQASGYEATGGGFNNALGRLRTLELIEGYTQIRASEELF